MFNLIKDMYWDFKPSTAEKTVCLIGLISVGTAVALIIG
jgi:hypothetical protein